MVSFVKKLANRFRRCDHAQRPHEEVANGDLPGLEGTLEANPNPIMVVDDGVVAFVNNPARQVFQCSPGDQAEPIFDVFMEGPRDKIRSGLSALKSGGSTVVTGLRCSLVTESGEEKNFSLLMYGARLHSTPVVVVQFCDGEGEAWAATKLEELRKQLQTTIGLQVSRVSPPREAGEYAQLPALRTILEAVYDERPPIQSVLACPNIENWELLQYASSYDGDFKAFVSERSKGWMVEYRKLLRLIRAEGYAFGDMENFTTEDLDKPIAYLRYDIHPKDIWPGLAMAAENSLTGATGVFYLNWDFSGIEVCLRDKYLMFKSFDDAAVIGFHASPIDSYMIYERFDGDISQFTRWVNGPKFQSWCDALMADPAGIRALTEGADIYFSALGKSLRRAVGGGVLTATAHGAPMASRAKKFAQVDEKYRALADTFSSISRIHDDLLADNDFTRETTIMTNQAGKRIPLAGDGAGREHFLPVIQDAMETRKAFAILIHPALWMERKFKMDFENVSD